MLACARTVPYRDRDVDLPRHTSRRASQAGCKAPLAEVNGLHGAAGLDVLGSFDEEILDTATEIKQHSGEGRTDPLKDEEP